ncbi:MAG: hypothetical protein P8Y03_30925, partial [Anaerolineales bacterium]
ADTRTVYATGVGGEGTFRTEDNGNTWKNVTRGGITHPFADEIVINPHNQSEIWDVADVGEVFRSIDQGLTWNRIINPYQAGFRYGSIYSLAPAPSDANIIYALKNGFGIFKSSNKGEDWQYLHQSQVDYTYSIAVHPTNPNIVYSGYLPKPFENWAMVRAYSGEIDQ